MRTHVVILGAGFGGLELATRLSEELADEAQVTLIDQSDSFVFGFSKLDVMFGRRTLDEVRLFYRDIAKPGVAFRQETIVSIDPERRHVVTDESAYDADILVVALGADLAPEATPGLVEGGYEFYTPAGAERARDVIADFDSGVAVIGVLGGFFKCPPAPNETAFMLHDYLSRRGVRDKVTIYLSSPLGKPIPISDETSNAIVALLRERDIEYWPGSLVTRLDPEAKVAHFQDGRQLSYDLFLAIPIHRAPAVVVESGLTEDGWIPVDVATFATRFPDVYAVGDVTSAPVPRAGVIAEGEASTLADVLIARLRGTAPPPPYQGAAVCYMEMGGDKIGRVDVNFLSGPGPTALFSPPSLALAKEKRQFGASRRRRWFGQSINHQDRMEELAPVLKTLPPGTQVAFIEEGDELRLYNISKAFDLVAGRPPTTVIHVVEHAQHIQPRDADSPADDTALIDPDHAATVDLSYPIMLLESREEGGGQGKIIDGWHRIYRAAQLGMTELPAVVITAEEEESIRIDPNPHQSLS